MNYTPNYKEQFPIPGFFESERIHPQAEDAFRQARNMDVPSQLHMFDACGRMFKNPSPANIEGIDSIRALKRFIADTEGGNWSVRRYDAWRAVQPDFEILPNATKIRRALGGWTKPIEAIAITPALALTSVRRRRRNASLTTEELIQFFREWIDDEEDLLTWKNFLAYASRRAASGHKVPQSRHVVVKRFSTLADALRAAGLSESEIEKRAHSNRAFSDAHLRDTLDTFLDWNGGPGRIHDFSRFSESEAAPRPCPSSTLLYLRLADDGTWSGLMRQERAKRAEEGS